MRLQTLSTTCCVVGGGPAGMMLGYLLARQGVHVTVLEKHQDFLRDFRGDTVHPSTLGLFHELGLLDEFLKLPHQQLEIGGIVIGDRSFKIVDFRHVPAFCKFIALMPQWDLLNFLASHAQKYPNFDLRMQHEVTGLNSDSGLITGVQVRTPNGPLTIQADLVVGCDGRHSTIRDAARLKVNEFGVPIDVLWFRISRHKSDPEELLGNANYGRAMVLINRGTYFQAGLIIPKGSFEAMKSAGLDNFHETVRKMAPYLGNRAEELNSWDQIKLLTVQLNRLKTWHRPGLLCIGDSAHAMSPAGGVGINLAIQDAVAAAKLLAGPLRDGLCDNSVMAAVQRRRSFPTKVTQFVQKNGHRALSRLFANPGLLEAPWQLEVAVQVPGIQRAMGRFIGMGARPEHIADVPARPRSGPVVRRMVLGAAVTAGALAGIVLLRKNRRALAAAVV